MKKYQLIKSDTIKTDDHILYRIKALIDFSDVKKDDLGGYIENKSNLSQDNLCWVSGNAQVFGDALVYGNALVSGNAQVFGDALVSGNAQVFGDALVYGNAQVYDNARVFGNAQVSGNARVYGDAHIEGSVGSVHCSIDVPKDWDIFKSVMEIFDQKELLPLLININPVVSNLIKYNLNKKVSNNA